MKHILTGVLLWSAMSAWAQGNFKFKEETHDFGGVEEGVQAVHVFEFVNSGDQPLQITNVQASCGCTTPDWTKDPIPPKGKGSITTSFNSSGRPGSFSKSITITSNANETTKVLSFRGYVSSKPANVVVPTADELKMSPVMVIDKKNYTHGKVELHQNVKHKFKVKNTGKSDLIISSVNSGCNCIALTAPVTIKAGDSGSIELVYTTNRIGESTDLAVIINNDITQAKTNVSLTATVVESITPPSILKEDKNAVPFK